MSLEDMYKNAAPDSYVGTARERQSSTATGAQLVNFLDGQKRGVTVRDDEFQTEFTRNEAGSYVAGGSQGVQRSIDENLTRWTDKAFKLAFDGEGPPTLIEGYYNNSRFRVDSGNRQVHMYAPSAGRRFADVNESAKSRVAASPSGAPSF